MKSLSRILSVAALGAAVVLTSLTASAQDADGDNGGGRRNRGGGQGGQGGGPGGGGNWDPAQMRQRMAERMREQFAVKDDAEWKLISERIEKVSDVRREMGGRAGMMMMMGGRGGGPGGAGGGRGGAGGEVNPEQDAFQKAIESNAPADEIKAKLAKYRASQNEKEAKLAKAQDELRQVLSVKQEGTAVLMGLLK